LVGFSGACSALLEPETNLTYSMRYLRLAIDRGGAGCGALALYNGDLGARPRGTRYTQHVRARM